MLELQNIFISYDEHDIIQDLSATFQDKQICGIVGLNGTGKTTLMRSIIGLKKQSSGIIKWNGIPVTNKFVGYLETEPYFYPMLTGREHLEFFRLQNSGFDLEKWNKIFDLPLDRRIDQYSKGMQKKLQILAVLCLNRPLLLLDEPFNNLDIETNQLLEVIFQQLKKNGKVLIITSHIIDPLLRLCDTISILKDGHFIWSKDHTHFNEISGQLLSDTLKVKSDIINDILD